MKTDNAQTIVEELYEVFTDICDQWPDKGTEAYIRQMAEHDILLLGNFFGAVDPIGQFAEYNLLAECISQLRMQNYPIKNHKAMDEMIEKLMEEFRNSSEEYKLPIASGTAEEMTDTMKSVALTADLHERHLITEDQKKALHVSFIKLANLFVMRDGIVTDKEFTAVQDFENHLNQLTSF